MPAFTYTSPVEAVRAAQSGQPCPVHLAHISTYVAQTYLQVLQYERLTCAITGVYGQPCFFGLKQVITAGQTLGLMERR
jgi:hypothetical protein